MTMQADNRPTRKRKIPARLASPSTQIETVTLPEGRTESENATPTAYPTTPVLSPTSSVFSNASTPCPATRTSGSRRRANPRGKSPTRSEIYTRRLSPTHRPPLIHITQVYESEAQRDELEREYTLAAMRQLEVIRRSRAVTVEDWNYALEEELHSKLPHTATNSSIPLIEIRKTIAYLKTFNVQEDLEGAQVDIIEGTNVIEEMIKYTRLGVGMEWDFGHEIGLRAYIYSETELAGEGDGVVMTDEEGGDKAVEPVRRPVGRPRKRGR
ncbi:hypothetical protein DID88_002183 [Monilinia fructigena]|uniref:Uncharacterized protein n=1 Tax=Monilinia fructigena TaxID=38457 RepID=A0A395IVG1_9HELO|nr:hypothetical protein DID88_002179 [Monilinia fructigena]RAL64291.1 hypothetical protein DID88_002183 [Monilinia fructigena]